MTLFKLSLVIPPLYRLKRKIHNFFRYTIPELLVIAGCAGVFLLIWMGFFMT